MSIEPQNLLGEVPRLRDLPASVRARVVALTAQVLPEVAKPPATLRKVAAFAPSRRARHGGSMIQTALETDDEFRVHVGVLVVAVVDGESSPADTAATLWLVRPDGVTSSLEAVLAGLAGLSGLSGPADGPSRKLATTGAAQRELLAARMAALQRADRDARGRHKLQLQKLKEENTELRRKLGETRAAERSARARSDRVAEELALTHAQASAASGAAEADVRRLRAQVEDLRASLRRGRRDVRADRDDASLRARLLLDTVLDAAAGLQRELGLPAPDGAPADRVDLARAEEGVRTPVSGLAPSSPALLEQYLALPRVHLIVDGYNVSKSAWSSTSLELQRSRLLTGLASLVARTRAEVTVVFDAAGNGPRPVVATPRGVRVVFSPEGVIADDVIREFVAAEPAGRVVVVATSDWAVVRDVVRAGARAVAAEALVGVIRR